jgi:hypothetical protein
VIVLKYRDSQLPVWSPGRELFDQEAVATENGVSGRTVRRRCEAIACNLATRSLLYDADTAAAKLGTVKPRPARTTAAQMLRRLQPA